LLMRQPRIRCAIGPLGNGRGVVLVDTACQWTPNDADMLARYVEEFLTQEKIRGAITLRGDGQSTARLWDTSNWLELEAESANERIKAAQADAELQRRKICQAISERWQLFRYNAGSAEAPSYIVDRPDSALLQELENESEKRELPDFFSDTRAQQAMTESLVTSNISLNLSPGFRVLNGSTWVLWRCDVTVNDAGGKAQRQFTAEDLELWPAICFGVAKYLEATQ